MQLLNAKDVKNSPTLIAKNEKVIGAEVLMNPISNSTSQRFYFIPCNGSSFFIEPVSYPYLVVQIPHKTLKTESPVSLNTRQPSTGHVGELFIVYGSYFL